MNQQLRSTDRNYPVRLLHRVCCLAGDPEFVAQLNSRGKHSLAAAIERHDTAALFDWLMQALSHQGIADRVADDYMQRHGRARWARIRAPAWRATPPAPSWSVTGVFTTVDIAKEPAPAPSLRHIAACPLPRQPLRNGHLNQMAYSLFLFMRDVADGDFVGWIDRQLAAVKISNLRSASCPARGHSSVRCATSTGLPTRSWRWRCRRCC